MSEISHAKYIHGRPESHVYEVGERRCKQTTQAKSMAHAIFPTWVIFYQAAVYRTPPPSTCSGMCKVTATKKPLSGHVPGAKFRLLRKENNSAKVTIAAHLCSPKQPSYAENSSASPAVKSTIHRAWPALALNFLARWHFKNLKENRPSGILLDTFEVETSEPIHEGLQPSLLRISFCITFPSKMRQGKPSQPSGHDVVFKIPHRGPPEGPRSKASPKPTTGTVLIWLSGRVSACSGSTGSSSVSPTMPGFRGFPVLERLHVSKNLRDSVFPSCRPRVLLGGMDLLTCKKPPVGMSD